MEQMEKPKQAQQNPLKQYFRTYKFYLRLPSGTSYYPPDSIEFTDTGEIGILPMTGKDELVLKNPDSLLNGEALVEVIKSCAPSIKNPKMLLTNDIEAIITAVRLATYNDGLETVINCPKCNDENTFKLNLQYALDNMEYLEDEYVANLDNGLSVFVRPYAYPEMVKGLHSQFEQSKITRSLEDQRLDEEEKLKIFSQAFKDMAKMSAEMVLTSIVKVVDEYNNVNVTDKKFIAEFLQNTDRTNINVIEDLIKEINQIGIKRTFDAKCSKCGHAWQSEIDFNPVNFS